MPVNHPVTLTVTQPTTAAHVDAPAKKLHITEATASKLSKHPARIPYISEATNLSLTHHKNAFLLAVTEATAGVEHPVVHKPFRIAQATVSKVSRTHGGVFKITEPTTLSMTGVGSHPRSLALTQSTTLTIDHPSVDRTLLVPEHVNVTYHSRVHPLPLHVSEPTQVLLDSASGRVHRLTVNQGTLVHTHHNSTSHHRINESTIATHHATPHRTYRVTEHATATERHLPIKALHASETTIAKHINGSHRRLPIAASTSVTRHTDARHTLHTTQASQAHMIPLPAIVSLIQEHVHLSKHAGTHREPFVISEATVARRSTDLNSVRMVHEATSVHMGPKRIVKYIKVPVATAAVVRAPQLVRNTVPIMGYVYEPTDIYGSQVQVLADLNDYYYLFSIPPSEIPTLYWGPSLHSANVPNDSYNYWKTK